MADDKSVSEETRAGTTILRGQVAAGIADPEEKKKFIAAQGEGKMTDAQLRQNAYDQRNKNAVSDVVPNYSLARDARKN